MRGRRALNCKSRPWSVRSRRPPRQSFAFGFRYTHFFYTLEAHPPFATLAVSPEFCVASSQDATECESVQFISGLAQRRPRADTFGDGSGTNRSG